MPCGGAEQSVSAAVEVGKIDIFLNFVSSGRGHVSPVGSSCTPLFFKRTLHPFVFIKVLNHTHPLALVVELGRTTHGYLAKGK
jgi:hypothetical protein